MDVVVVVWGCLRSCSAGKVVAWAGGSLEERMVMRMFLEGKVQTAKVGNFMDGLEVVVVDRQVVKPMGGRPQYTCKIVRGWPGIEDLRSMKKQGVSEADLAQYSAQIRLPQEDTVLPLVVVDITGSKGYKTLVCEIAASGQP